MLVRSINSRMSLVKHVMQAAICRITVTIVQCSGGKSKSNELTAYNINEHKIQLHTPVEYTADLYANQRLTTELNL